MSGKPTLRFVEETVRLVKDKDLDSFINAAYGFPKLGPYDWAYSFVPCEEAGNDSEHKFEVTPVQPDSRAREMIDNIANGEPELFVTQMLLDTLCYEGVIDAGTYIITVRW